MEEVLDVYAQPYDADNPVICMDEQPVQLVVVERSNAWVERCKSLVKNFERNLFNANQKLKLCFVRLLFKRLATLYPLAIPSKTES